MQRIEPSDLVDIALEGRNFLRADLIYAQPAHPLNALFKTGIYRPDARMWLHRQLADIVLLAARNAAAQNLRFVLTDGLRTIEAQQRMIETDIVRANPHWVADGPQRLLSPPGSGGHPRGMAVDIYLEGPGGIVLDMGTPLDYLSTDPADNPAARGYLGLSPEVRANRALLETLMLDAAKALNTELVPLASEWWDFRLPDHVYNRYAPLSDAALPPEMRMCA